MVDFSALLHPVTACDSCDETTDGAGLHARHVPEGGTFFGVLQWPGINHMEAEFTKLATESDCDAEVRGWS